MIKLFDNKMLLLALSLLFCGSLCAQEKHAIKMSFKQGQVLKYAMDIKQDIAQTINGQDSITKQLMGFDYKMTVDTVNADGSVVITTTYTGIRHTLKSPYINFSYDSKDGKDAPLQALAMAAMKDTELKMTMQANGDVTELTGVEAMVEKILLAYKEKANFNELQLNQMRQSLEKTVNADALKQTMTQMMKVYPPKPIAIDESWKHSLQQKSMISMQVDTDYTLNKADDKNYSISLESTISSLEADPNNPPMMKLDELKGTQSGSIIINKTDGSLISSEVKQSFSGVLKMSGMTIPMTVNGTVSVKKIP